MRAPLLPPSMSRLVPARRAVRRVALGAGAALATSQVAVAGAITTADLIRKGRSREFRPFPVADPSTDVVEGNEVTVYTYGEHLFEDMLAAIDAARHTVFLETYIWKNDEVGRRFRTALSAAAARGVEVYVIYDAFANLVVPTSFYDGLDERVKVLRFPLLRLGMLGLNLRNSGRDHRKILVTDRAVGFVGGYNIGDLYATRWRDTHLRITGPAVWELADSFTDMWNTYAKHRPAIADDAARSWAPEIRAHRNTPSQMLFPVRGMYLDAINRAGSHICFTQGYFIPDQDILAALIVARKRGVKVQVIIPEVSNHVLADWAARGYYEQMLEVGIEIWLYQGAMVHAKTATVDGYWTTIGSANIDRLSMVGNYEINMDIVNPGLARRMEEVFAMDLTRCRRLTREEWDHRGLLIRFSEKVMATLRPIM